MTEKIIQTRRGLYGQLSVTLPVTVKAALLDLQKKSGMKKSEFLRLALTTGVVELSKDILVAGWTADSGMAQGRPPVREEDGRPAPPPENDCS